MNANRVHLLTLSERTSAKGNTYLTGWLAKASVVAFRGEPDKWGNPTWDVFVSTPEPKAEAGQEPARRARADKGDDHHLFDGRGRDAAENRSERTVFADERGASATMPQIPADPSAPVVRPDGYRGPSRYVRPRDARRRDLLPEGELAEDGLDDLYR